MKKGWNKKNPKVKEIKFDAINGDSTDGTPWELLYNRTSKKYTLLSNGVFSYSHISLTACKNKAAEKEVTWK